MRLLCEYKTSTPSPVARSNITRYENERGHAKGVKGFLEAARTLCRSSTHSDRYSILADINFSLGVISMDAGDFSASRMYREVSLNLVLNICNEMGTRVNERLYLAYAERGVSRIQDRRYGKLKPTSRRHCSFAKRSASTSPARSKPTWAGLFLRKRSMKSVTTFFWIV
jgi:hypothetical protein